MPCRRIKFPTFVCSMGKAITAIGAGLIILAAIAAMRSYGQEEKTSGEKARVHLQKPAGTGLRNYYVTGIDLSHYNSVSSWESISADPNGVSFVYLKASEGATMQDETFSSRLTEAHKAGLKVGAYHYLTTASGIRDQFLNFHSAVCADSIDLVPVLDIERQSKGYPKTDEEYIAMIRDWIQLCRQYYGCRPMLYCNVENYRRYIEGNFDECLFWCGDINGYKPRVDSTDWYMWQHTIKHCDGVAHDIDFNIIQHGRSLEEIGIRKQ